MRWKNSIKSDIKIIRRFLLFPRCIGNECRWFEFVKIEQVYTDIDPHENHNKYENEYWFDYRWINN